MQKFAVVGKNDFLWYVFCMNDRFTSMMLFARVARAGSFSAVARTMGMTQPTASRIIAALERQVGVALFIRSTRAVTLTEAGSDYLARCEMILAALDEADNAARGNGELRGTLRIAAPPMFASRIIMPCLAGFTDRHPQLRIEFALNDARHDLIGQAIDVAIRIGVLDDSTSVARKVGRVRRVLVAAPAYLARLGKPRRPADLAKHTLITGPASNYSEGWTFWKDGKKVVVRIVGRFVVDATDAGTAAAVAGLGIYSTGHGSVQAELNSGALLPLLPDWHMGVADINVILPAGRGSKSSARAFADFIAAEIKKVEAGFNGDSGAAKS